MIIAVGSKLVAFGEDTLDDFGSVLCEVRRTEECRTHLILLQHIEEGVGACNGDTHLLLHRELDSVLTWHIKLLDIEAKQNTMGMRRHSI